MTIIESVKRYIAGYPGIEGGRLNVDFLSDEAGGFSIDATPAANVVKRYVDGATVRQFLFTLAGRAFYGPETRQQIENLGFFEDFAEWLEAQNRAKNFPAPGEGRTPLKIEVTTSGYVMIPGTETARYQIQCALTYFEKGGK